eukprot:gene1540-1800_t
MIVNNIDAFDKRGHNISPQLKILSPEWFNQCVINNRWESETPYLLDLPQSSRTLFGTIQFYVSTQFTPDLHSAISRRITEYGGRISDTLTSPAYLVAQYQTAPEYEKGMIAILGATYTKTLSKENTHLVCNKKRGSKYFQALDLGVKIVSKQWLESSISHWRYEDPLAQ